MFYDCLEFALQFIGLCHPEDGCTSATLNEFLMEDVFPYCGWAANPTLRNSVVRLLVTEHADLITFHDMSGTAALSCTAASAASGVGQRGFAPGKMAPPQTKATTTTSRTQDRQKLSVKSARSCVARSDCASRVGASKHGKGGGGTGSTNHSSRTTNKLRRLGGGLPRVSEDICPVGGEAKSRNPAESSRATRRSTSPSSCSSVSAEDVAAAGDVHARTHITTEQMLHRLDSDRVCWTYEIGSGTTTTAAAVSAAPLTDALGKVSAFARSTRRRTTPHVKDGDDGHNRINNSSGGGKRGDTCVTFGTHHHDTGDDGQGRRDNKLTKCLVRLRPTRALRERSLALPLHHEMLREVTSYLAEVAIHGVDRQGGSDGVTRAAVASSSSFSSLPVSSTRASGHGCCCDAESGGTSCLAARGVRHTYKPHLLTHGINRLRRQQAVHVCYMCDPVTQRISHRLFPTYAMPLTELEKSQAAAAASHRSSAVAVAQDSPSAQAMRSGGSYNSDHNGCVAYSCINNTPLGMDTPPDLLDWQSRRGNQPLHHYYARRRRRCTVFPAIVFDLGLVKYVVQSSPDAKMLLQDAVHVVMSAHGVHYASYDALPRVTKSQFRRLLVAAGLRVIAATLMIHGKARVVRLVLPAEDVLLHTALPHEMIAPHEDCDHPRLVSNRSAASQFRDGNNPDAHTNSNSNDTSRVDGIDVDNDKENEEDHVSRGSSEAGMLEESDDDETDRATELQQYQHAHSMNPSDSTRPSHSALRRQREGSIAIPDADAPPRHRPFTSWEPFYHGADWPLTMQVACAAEKGPVALSTVYPPVTSYVNEKARGKALLRYMELYARRRGSLRSYYILSRDTKSFTLVYEPNDYVDKPKSSATTTPPISTTTAPVIAPGATPPPSMTKIGTLTLHELWPSRQATIHTTAAAAAAAAKAVPDGRSIGANDTHDTSLPPTTQAEPLLSVPAHRVDAPARTNSTARPPTLAKSMNDDDDAGCAASGDANVDAAARTAAADDVSTSQRACGSDRSSHLPRRQDDDTNCEQPHVDEPVCVATGVESANACDDVDDRMHTHDPASFDGASEDEEDRDDADDAPRAQDVLVKRAIDEVLPREDDGCVTGEEWDAPCTHALIGQAHHIPRATSSSSSSSSTLRASRFRPNDPSLPRGISAYALNTVLHALQSAPHHALTMPQLQQQMDYTALVRRVLPYLRRTGKVYTSGLTLSRGSARVGLVILAGAEVSEVARRDIVAAAQQQRRRRHSIPTPSIVACTTTTTTTTTTSSPPSSTASVEAAAGNAPSSKSTGLALSADSPTSLVITSSSSLSKAAAAAAHHTIFTPLVLTSVPAAAYGVARSAMAQRLLSAAQPSAAFPHARRLASVLMGLRNGQARPAVCRAGRLHLELWRQFYRRCDGAHGAEQIVSPRQPASTQSRSRSASVSPPPGSPACVESNDHAVRHAIVSHADSPSVHAVISGGADAAAPESLSAREDENNRDATMNRHGAHRMAHAAPVGANAAEDWVTAEEVWREMSVSTFCIVVGLTAVDVDYARETTAGVASGQRNLWGRALRTLPPVWQAWCSERGTAPFLHGLSILQDRQLIYCDTEQQTRSQHDCRYRHRQERGKKQAHRWSRRESMDTLSLTPLSELRLRLAPVGYRAADRASVHTYFDPPQKKDTPDGESETANGAHVVRGHCDESISEKVMCGFVFWRGVAHTPGSTAYAVLRYWMPEWSRAEKPSRSSSWVSSSASVSHREGALARRAAAVYSVEANLTFPRLLALSRVLRCDVAELAVRVYQCCGQPWRTPQPYPALSRASASRAKLSSLSSAMAGGGDAVLPRDSVGAGDEREAAHTCHRSSIMHSSTRTRGATRRDDVTAAAVAQALERGCESGGEMLTRRVSAVLQLLERTRRAHRALRMSGALGTLLSTTHAAAAAAAAAVSSSPSPFVSGLSSLTHRGRSVRGGEAISNQAAAAAAAVTAWSEWGSAAESLRRESGLSYDPYVARAVVHLAGLADTVRHMALRRVPGPTAGLRGWVTSTFSPSARVESIATITHRGTGSHASASSAGSAALNVTHTHTGNDDDDDDDGTEGQDGPAIVRADDGNDEDAETRAAKAQEELVQLRLRALAPLSHGRWPHSASSSATAASSSSSSSYSSDVLQWAMDVLRMILLSDRAHYSPATARSLLVLFPKGAVARGRRVLQRYPSFRRGGRGGRIPELDLVRAPRFFLTGTPCAPPRMGSNAAFLHGWWYDLMMDNGDVARSARDGAGVSHTHTDGSDTRAGGTRGVGMADEDDCPAHENDGVKGHGRQDGHPRLATSTDPAAGLPLAGPCSSVADLSDCWLTAESMDDYTACTEDTARRTATSAAAVRRRANGVVPRLWHQPTIDDTATASAVGSMSAGSGAASMALCTRLHLPTLIWPAAVRQWECGEHGATAVGKAAKARRTGHSAATPPRRRKRLRQHAHRDRPSSASSTSSSSSPASSTASSASLSSSSSSSQKSESGPLSTSETARQLYPARTLGAMGRCVPQPSAASPTRTAAPHTTQSSASRAVRASSLAAYRRTATAPERTDVWAQLDALPADPPPTREESAVVQSRLTPSSTSSSRSALCHWPLQSHRKDNININNNNNNNANHDSTNNSNLANTKSYDRTSVAPAYPSIFHHVDGSFHRFVWYSFLVSLYRYVLAMPGVSHTALRCAALASGLVSARAFDCAVRALLVGHVLRARRTVGGVDKERQMGECGQERVSCSPFGRRSGVCEEKSSANKLDDDCDDEENEDCVVYYVNVQRQGVWDVMQLE